MSAIKPERSESDWLGISEKSVADKYAPSVRRIPPNASHAPVTPAPNAGETEIKNVVWREDYIHRPTSDVMPLGDQVTQNINLLIRHVDTESTDHIERVARELDSVREILRNERERVSREVADYAGLNQTVTITMKTISDSIKQWKTTPPKNS
jgi:hypothetical protein